MRAERKHGKIAAGNAQRQAGFSVIEAIAAVALIAVAFLPLLALQGQLSRTALAVERAEATVVAKKNALARLRATNPMLEPRGVEDLGGALLAWRAVPVEPEKPALDAGGAPGRFSVALFNIEARLLFPDGREETFVVQGVGWRATRSALDF